MPATARTSLNSRTRPSTWMPLSLIMVQLYRNDWHRKALWRTTNERAARASGEPAHPSGGWDGARTAGTVGSMKRLLVPLLAVLALIAAACGASGSGAGSGAGAGSDDPATLLRQSGIALRGADS